MLKPTILKYFPYVLSGVLIFIMFLVLNDLSRVKDENKDLLAKATWSSPTKVDTIINKQGKPVLESAVIETATDKDLKELSSKYFQLQKQDEKRIKTITELTELLQQTTIDSVLVPYTDTVKIKDSDALVVPTTFRDSTKNYKINGTVLLTGVRINSLTIPDSLFVQLVEQRPKGFLNNIFQKNRTMVQVLHSNPLVSTKDVKTIQVKLKPSAWNRWIKPVVFATLGIFLGGKLL